jgi:hypothetical protein
MKSIFVICAGARQARINFEKSVLHPVPSEDVLPKVPEQLRPQVQSWQQPDGFFLWGIKPGQRISTMLSSVEAGDLILGFFHLHYRTASRFIGKAHCSELAALLWGSENWSTVLFLSTPLEIEVRASSLQPYLCSTYRGAARIAPDRIAQIIKDFGSIDAFAQQKFGDLNGLTGHA